MYGREESSPYFPNTGGSKTHHKSSTKTTRMDDDDEETNRRQLRDRLWHLMEDNMRLERRLQEMGEEDGVDEPMLLLAVSPRGGGGGLSRRHGQQGEADVGHGRGGSGPSLLSDHQHCNNAGTLLDLWLARSSLVNPLNRRSQHDHGWDNDDMSLLFPSDRRPPEQYASAFTARSSSSSPLQQQQRDLLQLRRQLAWLQRQHATTTVSMTLFTAHNFRPVAPEYGGSASFSSTVRPQQHRAGGSLLDLRRLQQGVQQQQQVLRQEQEQESNSVGPLRPLHPSSASFGHEEVGEGRRRSVEIVLPDPVMVDDRVFPSLIPMLPKSPTAVNIRLFPRLTVPYHHADISNVTTATRHNDGGIGALDVRKRQRRNEEEQQLQLLPSNHVEKKRPRPSSDHRTVLFMAATAAPQRQKQPPQHPLIRSSQSSSVLQKGAAAAQRQKQPPRPLIRSSQSSSSSSPTASAQSLQSDDESKTPPTGCRCEKAVHVSHEGVPVALDSDGDYLTRYQVVLRQCLEFFTATVSDVETSVQGRKHKLQLGQVRVVKESVRSGSTAHDKRWRREDGGSCERTVLSYCPPYFWQLFPHAHVFSFCCCCCSCFC
jgi:hypothetical protein